MDYENTSTFDSFELQLTATAQDFLRETGKWAKFLSILGFIFIALFVLFGLFFFALGSTMDSAMAQAGGGMSPFGALTGGFLGGLYIVFAIIYFFPVLYLFRFSAKIGDALASKNSQLLADALENLKSHYKFLGIVAIIMIAFWILSLVFGIIAGVGAAM